MIASWRALQPGPSDLRPNCGQHFASIADRTTPERSRAATCSLAQTSSRRSADLARAHHVLHSVLHRGRQSPGVAGRHFDRPESARAGTTRSSVLHGYATCHETACRSESHARTSRKIKPFRCERNFSRSTAPGRRTRSTCIASIANNTGPADVT